MEEECAESFAEGPAGAVPVEFGGNCVCSGALQKRTLIGMIGDKLRALPLVTGVALAACASPASTVSPGQPGGAADAPTAELLSLRFEEHIAAPPSMVWEALTTAEHTRKFFHGTSVRTALTSGGEHDHLSGDGSTVVIDGTIRTVSAPDELVFEFRFPEYEDAPTLVSYRLVDPGDGTTTLTIEHSGFEGRTQTYRRVTDGWPPVLSGLKTLLEGGEAAQE